GLSAAEVGNVTQEIQKLGIPVEFDLQGNVLVPSEKVAEVRAKLAVAGKLPSTGHIGNAELGKLGMMMTPSVERERLKTILEGELAQSVEAIHGVASARVHITLGDQSLYATEKKPATASIFVAEDAGAGLGPEQARAVATLVANAVTGLEPKNVFVTDNTGRALWDGSEQEGSSAIAAKKLEAEVSEARRRERELQQKLDSTFGRGNTMVTVNLELDFDKRRTERSVVTPTKPLVKTETKETLGRASTNPGPGGVAPNSGEVSPSSTDDQSYGGSTSYEVRGEDKENTFTEVAAGQVKSMSIAVLVNEKKGIAEDVESFVAGYLGPKIQDPEHFSQTVTEVQFDETAATQAKAAEQAALSRDRMQQIFSMLPIGALVLVAFMVIRAVNKAAKSQNVLMTALPGGGLMPAGVGALSEGDQTHPEVITGAELSRALAVQETEEEIGEIAEKVNKPLEQIKKMSTEKPENVALLIKSWMLEERR
ncbi:MAG TPA: flagellar M-ring protein FliF C-terminal domain-containing protein, partial [Fimbriimonadaceae bacterium]|nr:flagellar M-ring protein FliF C-terminal domain-containing protein [Fimbriimonadaceae bacterium]